jgi:hypothetical protein
LKNLVLKGGSTFISSYLVTEMLLLGTYERGRKELPMLPPSRTRDGKKFLLQINSQGMLLNVVDIPSKSLAQSVKALIWERLGIQPCQSRTLSYRSNNLSRMLELSEPGHVVSLAGFLLLLESASEAVSNNPANDNDQPK